MITSPVVELEDRMIIIDDVPLTKLTKETQTEKYCKDVKMQAIIKPTKSTKHKYKSITLLT